MQLRVLFAVPASPAAHQLVRAIQRAGSESRKQRENPQQPPSHIHFCLFHMQAPHLVASFSSCHLHDRCLQKHSIPCTLGRSTLPAAHVLCTVPVPCEVKQSMPQIYNPTLVIYGGVLASALLHQESDAVRLSRLPSYPGG
jgi:hypothetical protein